MKLKGVILAFVAVVLVTGLITGCGKDKEVTFKGVIIEWSETTAVVTPDEGEQILNSGDKVVVDMTKGDGKFTLGDRVLVTYDGTVMESYPLQIRTIRVEHAEP